MKAVLATAVWFALACLCSCGWKMEAGSGPPLGQQPPHAPQVLISGEWSWFAAGFAAGILVCLAALIVWRRLGQGDSGSRAEQISHLRKALAAIDRILKEHRVSGKVVRLRPVDKDNDPDPPDRI